MTLAQWDGLWWLLLLLGPLLLLQRKLHLDLQRIFLSLTRKPAAAILLFSLLFLPGVALHEASHFLMAKLLFVRTGRVSLIPKPISGGKLQLGFVETAHADALREALIGAAPLIIGGIFVAYAGLVRMGLVALGERAGALDLAGMGEGLIAVTRGQDFWLWFYLAFAVSSTMLPSESDRRSWVPIVGSILLVVIAAVVAGGGPWLVSHWGEPLNRALRAVSAVLAISVGVHLVLLLPVWGLRNLLSRI